MEFISQENKILQIYNTKIFFEGVDIPITKIDFLKGDYDTISGKIHTENFLLKIKTGVVFLYDNETNNLLRVYKFKRYISNEPKSTNYGDYDEDYLCSFIVKINYTVHLYKKYLLIEKEDKTEKEDIINIHSVGSDTIYTTENGNKLSVGTKRNSKFNGIPIGKL